MQTHPTLYHILLHRILHNFALVRADERTYRRRDILTDGRHETTCRVKKVLFCTMSCYLDLKKLKWEYGGSVVQCYN